MSIVDELNNLDLNNLGNASNPKSTGFLQLFLWPLSRPAFTLIRRNSWKT